MAVIQFTQADVMATKVIDGGIYPCEITKLEGPKPSTSGKSVSYYVEIGISEGPMKGKSRTIVFNSGTQSYSLLGDQQYFPQAEMLLLVAAISKKGLEPCNVDTDSLVRQPFDAQWAVETVDGRLINTVKAFYPAGYAKQAPAF